MESDLFMDELKSSSSHKNLKKRKRIPSHSEKSKNEAESPKVKLEPPQFYKDTLEETGDEAKSADDKEKSKSDKETSEKMDVDADDDKKAKKESSEKTGADAASDEKMEDSEPEEPVKKPPGIGCGPDGPPGVLMIHRRKGPKKKLTWKPQEELEDVRFFELDETERCNVTKTFIEKKQMERYDERNAFTLGRKLSTDEVLVEQVPWRKLIPVDGVPEYAYGSLSREKKIQEGREARVLQSIFFTFLPDSADEPDYEVHEYSEPKVMPLDDLTGNPDAVNDFTNISWPDPKPDMLQEAPNLMNAFPNVFPSLPGAPVLPGMIPSPFDNALMRGATPFDNSVAAMWNMNQFKQMNSFGNMPLMMNDKINPPSLVDNIALPFPFAAPPINNLALNNLRPNNNNNLSNNMNSRPRDRDDRRPFHNTNNNSRDNWRNDNRTQNNRNSPGSRNNWIHNNRNQCHQFAQKGYCRNGDNCNYSHQPQF